MEVINMPAVRPSVHLPALQMMHVLGATTALLDHDGTAVPSAQSSWAEAGSSDEDEERENDSGCVAHDPLLSTETRSTSLGLIIVGSDDAADRDARFVVDSH
jgi:hypothetical protein